MTPLILLAALILSDPPTTPPPDDTALFLGSMQPYQRAYATHRDSLYEIAADDTRGFSVRRISSDVTTGFLMFPEMGKVTGIVGMSKQVQKEWTMFVLGLAIMSDDGANVEYRMCNTGRVTPEPKDWACSEVLLRKPIADAYEMMSIAVVQGDSTVLTLSRLTRGSDHDSMSTQVLVDHCPPNAGGISKAFVGVLRSTGQLVIR